MKTQLSKSPADLQAKLEGQTRYVHDMRLPGQLVGKILRSPHPHARIVRLDVSRARAIKGVVAVLTGEDVPHHTYGPTKFKDWNILARDRVLFIGDEIAAVAAETDAAAKQAIAAIEVEYEELPGVFDPEEAMQPGAPVLHETIAGDNRPMRIALERGDVERHKQEAAVVKSGRYRSNRIYQGHLEPIGAIASWSDEEGITIWAPSHIPYRARETYAAGFGLPEDKVRIVVPPIGGSFGSKYVLKVHVIAAALAMAARRPVKIIMDRYEDMVTAHPRVPLTFDLEIGADREGNLLYKDVVVYADAGARVYWSPNVIATACTRPDNIYRFQSAKSEGHLCYTNNSPTTCMRGFGNAEMLFAVESVIDEIALELGMDPAELRLRNIVRPGERTIHGYRLDTCLLEECIDKVKAISGWERRADLPPYRGMGIALANHVSGFRAIDPRFDGSTAVLRLKGDGSLELETGEIELGQGMSLSYARIAAQVLGVPEGSILVKSGDTGRYPFGIGTLASRSTVMGGNAAKLAAEALQRRLVSLACEVLGKGASLEDGRIRYGEETYPLSEAAAWHRARHAGEELTVRETYVPDTEMPDATYYGHPSPNYPFAAHVAEVEVDPDTGRTRVVGYWAVHDSGTIIHETMAKGQVYGAVAQGIGWVTMEDLIVEQGRVKNPSMMDYRMPGARDIPNIEIAFLEGEDPNGPLGAKSLGEVALDPVPGAIANAIAHATGKRGYELPLSAERVWRAIHST
ncbi:xanthine dehydrogenase family protein molybdopterin-binding subunit [Paenibacillus sp. IB182496]|uniref:Xanthine dehydrogenase family protein molybdopterin-binding subunit n=1 Tax=Paenibacillus sabuli TaxID=2772509 RepID=A0A927BND3_9BACL|nr:xanthine dehydrogenase family protein molybdopterin-binding subunit [Paenibacillus sabuli]MBD2843733.1 xanthine dehydrogenase family protein molybdopterin-binding subunit [Paenibacillus sabuli]